MRAGSPSETLLHDEVTVAERGGKAGFDGAFPPYNPVPWPACFSLRREDLYDDRGRRGLVFDDTNVLIQARFTVAPSHSLARAWPRGALASTEQLRICRQILCEYLAVVTRPQIWSASLAMPDALQDVRWFVATFDLLEDGPDVTRELTTLCRDVPIGGRQIHVSNIVAAMVAHGEQRLVTFAQDDFRQFRDRIVVVDFVQNV
ncbi:MAG: hypothetical protein OXC19_17915 [Bryobacterales bacterium]|nr:hypothetical protein [Bryobacterales bacterium]